MTRGQRIVVRTFLCVALFGALGACRRDQPNPSASTGTTSEAGKAKQADLLVFPDELRVADASINDFVTKAMTTCAKGEYQPFRLLWSAKEDPLPREEFEQGWQAVQTIKVRGLEKVMLDADPNAGRSEPQTVYALLAEVSLDPTQKPGQKDPQRHVVLMLTREHDEWRLAKAPKPMRAWIKDRIAAGETPSPRLNSDDAD